MSSIGYREQHLQVAEILRAEEENKKHVNSGDEHSDPERQPEEQVHGSGGANNLRQICRRDCNLLCGAQIES